MTPILASRRLLDFQGMRSADHRNACCLPGTHMCCGPDLSERETPAFHPVGPGSEGRPPGSLGRTALP